MHYFLDGYNLLFRFARQRESLQTRRENIIAALNTRAHLLKLNLTLVFDGSQPKPAEAQRGHFDALEIVYTPEDQSADDYILRELENCRYPSRETIVTSDRHLAERSSLLGARVQSIAEFVDFLLRKQDKSKKAPAKVFRDTEKNIQRLLLIFEERLKDSQEREN